MTADELLRLPEIDCRYDLLQGELRTKPFESAEHGLVTAAIIASLGAHVKLHKLGSVLAPCGFLLSRDPDTVLAPDVAFVRRERIVRSEEFFDGPPDVAFEVVSPEEKYTPVSMKLDAWKDAGVRAVVVVNLKSQKVEVLRRDGGLRVRDTLTLDDIIPGWRMPLAEIFD